MAAAAATAMPNQAGMDTLRCAWRYADSMVGFISWSSTSPVSQTFAELEEASQEREVVVRY